MTQNPWPAPPMPMTRSQKIALLFNEWQRRYAADPESFAKILDSQGRPIEDYGQRCAVYLERLEQETGIRL